MGVTSQSTKKAGDHIEIQNTEISLKNASVATRKSGDSSAAVVSTDNKVSTGGGENTTARN